MQDVQDNQNQCFSQARELFEQIISWLNSDSVCGLQHSDLEKNLWINGKELLRILLQGYLDSRKEDEIEGECSGIDDEKRTHKRHQSRTLMTIFGEVIVSRIAYGGRKITSLKPLDGELNLPWEKYSHGLAEKVSQTVAFNGFDKTEELIKENTGGKIPKRQLEEIAQKSVCDFEEFYQAQQKQEVGKKTGEIMVLTMDGKGVVMRQEDLREQTKTRAKNSEKKLKKRLSNRMDITGARWSLKGAEAVLRLRSLCVSGDWGEYWQFHLNKECQRNHQDLYKGGIPLLQKVSSARCSTMNPPKLMMA